MVFFILHLFVFWLSQHLILCEQTFGRKVGSFQQKSHQVRGDVFAVNSTTFLLKNFMYDGLGRDTYFFVGTSTEPSERGTLVPNERGKTNLLRQYTGEDILITVPPGKPISEFKWLAVWDVSEQKSFGDVQIPGDFEAPREQIVGPLLQTYHNVKSEDIKVIDAKTIKIPKFYFDGAADAIFWAGVGQLPSSHGLQVPTESGYDKLSRYTGQTVTLRLPGETTVLVIDWLCVWDPTYSQSYGYVMIPANMNIPPSMGNLVGIGYSRLPNCERLHQRLQVSWEVFGGFLTIQLAGLLESNEYMAFGFSGSNNISTMVGADVAVAWWDGVGKVEDYFVTARAPCSDIAVGNAKRGGVCADTALGGINDLMALETKRENGLTIISYQRPLKTTDVNFDRMIVPEELVFIIWAIGPLDTQLLPSKHTLYSRSDRAFRFSRPNEKNCDKFDTGIVRNRQVPWPGIKLTGEHTQTFVAQIGPSGGEKGYAGLTGFRSWGLAWYINGSLIPELVLKRGVKYRFFIQGGKNPQTLEYYHPFYITSEPEGGFAQKKEADRIRVRLFAGVRRGANNDYEATAVGPLCLWKELTNNVKPEDYSNFFGYKRQLGFVCESGQPGILEFTPDATTPDVVFYQSYTQRNLGWKITIVDAFEDPITHQRVGASAEGERGGAVANVPSVVSLFCLAWAMVWWF
ncbi:protein Skeletor, isoforms B/C-like [Paramacrobiotus metropolitanus]|uniref:protein Skeletor, isoforms B/C-like n=1 Tax=Paramacrobiotus metropolitanus TaxID=2943436 RepID=UPI002445C8ED|nr:protein Skeletor, isoforms B/C-like [Paramacrobiotus metropolitanus]